MKDRVIIFRVDRVMADRLAKEAKRSGCETLSQYLRMVLKKHTKK